MNDEEFLKFVPRCAECGEILPPITPSTANTPADHAVLRLLVRGKWRHFDFHAGCAPSLCKPAHVTVISEGVFDEAVLARWAAA